MVDQPQEMEVSDDSGNPIPVVGNVAAAASDSGNPVKVGGVFNTTQPTLTDGQRGNIQLSNRGAQLIAGSAAVGAAPVDNPVSVSGIDDSGFKRHVRTDSYGRVQIVTSGTIISQRNEPAQYAIDQKGFSLYQFQVNAQTTETKLFSIENPNGSGKTLYIYSWFAETDPGSNNWCTFRMYLQNTSISAGTTQTPRNIYAGSATASVITARTLPTVTTLGQLIAIRSTVPGSTAGMVTAPYEKQAYVVLPANTNLVITGAAKANNVPVNFGFEWAEV